MTHQCPKCELRFSWPTELDDHCRTDHPEFRHDYPASVHHDFSGRAVSAAGPPVRRHGAEDVEAAGTTAAILQTWWGER
jgi:hypothetical protein